VVKKIQHRASKIHYACKIMRKYDIEKEMTSRSEFDLVASITPHPSIVKAHEFIVTQRWTYLIMEMFEG